MIGKKLPVVLAALSIGMASAVGAATVFPNGTARPHMAETKGVLAKVATAASLRFDEFEADHQAARKARYAQASSGNFFAGPSVLVSTADSNSFGMMLASLGLMALIVHRRRSM